jgi:hypothetical protein
LLVIAFIAATDFQLMVFEPSAIDAALGNSVGS